jgi:hypothetical protein
MSTLDDDARPDEIEPDIEAWATAHGFAASDRELAGQTPLLRAGMVDITADAYEGEIAGHDALLAELSIASPGLSDAFGGSGVDGVWFTLFAVSVERPGWRRLMVRPHAVSEGDWIKRLLREDRRVHDIAPGFDERYHVIASTSIPDAELRAFFDDEVVAALLRHGDVVCELEADELDSTLVVAREGIGVGDTVLDALLEQALLLTERLEA